MINATNESNGSNYAPVPAGTYIARCYSMVHLGTNEETIQGKVKTMNKVRITWELPTETKEFKEGEGEKPFNVSKEFNLSMNEKATLRKFLESWRGKQFTEDEAKCFDVTNVLGAPCMVSVIHKTSQGGKTYADVSSVSAMPKGIACPPAVNPNFEFSLAEFDEVKFNTLPDFLKDKIKTSVEYKALSNTKAPEPEDKSFDKLMASVADADDLPF